MMKHAIIGCGRIAKNHYNAATANNIEIICCCDIDIKKAKEFAEQNNIKIVTDNYIDIINNPDIDSVSICTDHASHTVIAEKFLGEKHILIEKPFSTKTSLALDFAKKAKQQDKVVSIISQHRFDDIVILVKKMLKDKALGDICLVNANLKCNRDEKYYAESYWRGTVEKEGGSTVINQSFHVLDTLVYLLGVPAKSSTYMKNIKFKKIIETEDTCASIFEYPDFLMTFSSTNASVSEWETNIEIIGTDGEITFNIDFPERILNLNIPDNIKNRYEADLKKISENYEINKNLAVNYYGLSHIKQFKNFKNAILGKEKLKVGVDEALDTQKVLKSIYNR